MTMSVDIPQEIIRPIAEPEDMMPYLVPTPTIDCENPEIVAFARKHGQGPGGVPGTAVRLYYAVRDGLRYDPNTIDVNVDGSGLIDKSPNLTRASRWPGTSIFASINRILIVL